METNKPCTCADAEAASGPETAKHPLIPRTSDEKRKISNRLKRVEGQVRGIEKMIENDRYCIDVLVQITAVQAALKNIGFSVLERHTKACVATAIENGHGEEQINELLNALKYFK